MIRTEISLFLKNAPGELGKLTSLFAEAAINIDAITIQDASSYVQELFKARGKSLKRIASAASYNSMRKDSAAYALIRLLPADGKTNAAIDMLSKNDYLFDMLPVIAQDAGMSLEDTEATMATFVFPSVEEQMNEKWLGGGAQEFMKGVADVFVEAGSIDNTCDFSCE
jgi:hypothetical protein